MPLEKFSVLSTWEETLRAWSRQLDYIQRNFDAKGVLVEDSTGLFTSSPKTLENVLKEIKQDLDSIST